MQLENWRAAVAAQLFAKRLPQKEIAKELSSSEPMVSRWLADARESGAVVYRFDESRLTEEAREGMENWFTKRRFRGDENVSAELATLLDPCGVERIVVTKGGDTSESWGARLDQFGLSIHDELLKTLLSCRRVGIAWGETVGRALLSLAKRVERPPKRRIVQFVPLCGESPQYTPYSATVIAAKLHQWLNEKSKKLPLSLAGVPAFLPIGVAPAEFLNKVRRVVEDYERIFPESDTKLGLVDQCEIIVTSAGRIDQNVLAYLMTQLPKSKARQFRKAILGDVCGILLPKHEATKPEQSLIEECRELWTGLKKRHLVDASGNPKTKLAFLAIDKNKCEITCELLQRKWIRYLFCDEGLARAILNSKQVLE